MKEGLTMERLLYVAVVTGSLAVGMLCAKRHLHVRGGEKDNAKNN